MRRSNHFSRVRVKRLCKLLKKTRMLCCARSESLAVKAYDQVVRPTMTQDGTLDQETQAKAVEHVLKRLDLKEAPPLAKVFDFTITRKVSAELQAKGWKP